MIRATTPTAPSHSTTPSAARRDGADLMLNCDGPAGTGQLSLWWSQPLAGPGAMSGGMSGGMPGSAPCGVLGRIGAFSATTEAATHQLLAEAEHRLHAQGCTHAVGPLDGNTWHRYRFVTDPGDTPPFFLEPQQPPTWPAWWRTAGYQPCADYVSAATTTAAFLARDPRVPAVAARLGRAGVTLRPLQLSALPQELARLHAVSLVAFQNNYLYTPLGQAEFLALYSGLEARLWPDLVLLAERAGLPVGFVFALPDWAQAARGETMDTLIVKTLAILPGRELAGLGAWLLDEVQAAATRRGLRRAIHALMHADNVSVRLSARQTQIIRRYSLFRKTLGTSA